MSSGCGRGPLLIDDSTSSSSGEATGDEGTSVPTSGGEVSTGSDGTSTGSEESLSEASPSSEASSSSSSTGDDGETSSSDTGIPVCGDGVVEGTEACDDGNQQSGDGCQADCTVTPVCGNGLIEIGEACDDGNNSDGDGCSAECQVEPFCGDGMVEEPEICDDGNNSDGDGCEADCTLTPPICGNGVLEGDEQCDDGNDVDGGPNDFCGNDCTIVVPALCEAPVEYVVCDEGLDLADKTDKTAALRAFGICNDLPDNSVLTANFEFDVVDEASWQVTRGFGTGMIDEDMDPNTPEVRVFGPREGEALLMLSTGKIAAPNGEGVVLAADGSQVSNNNNGNPDAPNSLPAPLSLASGSNGGTGGTPFAGCDGLGDCSETLFDQWNKTNNPNDQLFFSFDAAAPAGTFAYRFDVAFCSSEWPMGVGSDFNDMVVVWQSDPTAPDPDANPPVDPFTGNMLVVEDPNEPGAFLPVTATALDQKFIDEGFVLADPGLAGTGFDGHACTAWRRVQGRVQPGATIHFGFFLADMGDSQRATVVLLDRFRWHCALCDDPDECEVP